VWTPLNPLWTTWIALALYAIGFITIARKRPASLYLLVGPIVFALLASGLRKYPFHGRLLMFLVPLVWIVIARGVDTIARRTSRVVGLLLVGFLICTPMLDVIDHLVVARREVFDSHGDLRNDLLDYLDTLRWRAPARFPAPKD
jgi:hypothetical protein